MPFRVLFALLLLSVGSLGTTAAACQTTNLTATFLQPPSPLSPPSHLSPPFSFDATNSGMLAGSYDGEFLPPFADLFFNRWELLSSYMELGFILFCFTLFGRQTNLKHFIDFNTSTKLTASVKNNGPADDIALTNWCFVLRILFLRRLWEFQSAYLFNLLRDLNHLISQFPEERPLYIEYNCKLLDSQSPSPPSLVSIPRDLGVSQVVLLEDSPHVEVSCMASPLASPFADSLSLLSSSDENSSYSSAFYAFGNDGVSLCSVVSYLFEGKVIDLISISGCQLISNYFKHVQQFELIAPPSPQLPSPQQSSEVLALLDVENSLDEPPQLVKKARKKSRKMRNPLKFSWMEDWMVGLDIRRGNGPNNFVLHSHGKNKKYHISVLHGIPVVKVGGGYETDFYGFVMKRVFHFVESY